MVWLRSGLVTSRELAGYGRHIFDSDVVMF